MADEVSIKQEPADVYDEDSSPDAKCDVKEEIEIGHTIIQPTDLHYQMKLEPVKEEPIESTSIRKVARDNDNTKLDKNQQTFLKKTPKQIKRNRFHMRTHGDELLHECTFCHMLFFDKSRLSTHMMTHTYKLPCPFEICEKSLSNKNSHTQVHTLTGERQYTCTFCEKLFTREHNLRRHMMIHTDERPFVCQYCEKSFIQKNCLKKHIMTHTGERPYTCELCKKSFTQKETLNYHMMYTSKLCKNAQKDTLNTHMINAHTDKRRYACKLCKKSFKQNNYFKKHMMTHTGEQPYKCNFCEKLFTSIHHLRRHMMIHTGERPYTCKFCEKSFIQKYQLRRHMMTHTGERMISM